MKRIAAVFLFLILGLSIIPVSLQAYEGELVYMSPLFLTTDANETSRTLYLGGEGRTYKEMLACGLWLEKNWERWQSGKVSKGEKCEDFSTDSLVILRITKGRIVLGENSYYIDYTSKSNIVSREK